MIRSCVFLVIQSFLIASPFFLHKENELRKAEISQPTKTEITSHNTFPSDKLPHNNLQDDKHETEFLGKVSEE